MELRKIPYFFSQRIYAVPSYQRGYSWKDEHVLDLLRDIDNAIQLKSDHYVGTITLFKTALTKKVGLNNYSVYEIVDGQQRFTTIMIILSVLINKLLSQKETKKEAEEKKETYLNKKGTYIFSYEVDEVSNHFFRSEILNIERKSSLEENVYTRNLLEAKTTVHNFFEAPQNSNRVIDFLGAIEEILQFNEYVVANTAEIGVVFETMNNRGIDLSTLELVKNRLLYLTSKAPIIEENKSEVYELANSINKSWATILKNLTLPDKVLEENAFLNNHWIVYNGWSKDNQAKYQILKVQFTIEAMVKDPKGIITKIKDYLNSLTIASLYWRYINYPSDDLAFKEIDNERVRENVRSYLIKLNRLNNSTVRPIILASFFNIKTKQSHIIEILMLSELFSFRVYEMNKRRSDTGKNDLFRRAHTLVNGSDNNFQIIKYLMAWYVQTYGTYTKFEFETTELLRSPKKEWFYSWSGLVYFLYEFEESLRGSANRKVSYSFASKKSSSIEHILPQKATEKYWVRHFKSKANKKDYLHNLGNLVLVAKERNSAYKHFGYDVKAFGSADFRNAYVNGSFSEIKVAREYKEWTPDNILDRQNNLLIFLKKRWELDVDQLAKFPWPSSEPLLDTLISDESEEIEFENIEL